MQTVEMKRMATYSRSTVRFIFCATFVPNGARNDCSGMRVTLAYRISGAVEVRGSENFHYVPLPDQELSASRVPRAA